MRDFLGRHPSPGGLFDAMPTSKAQGRPRLARL